ncbi:MAG: hypothetical protein WHW07_05855 [Bacteroidales bacterium]|nr:hypothetical protein [Bacteroidales bacterium]HOL96952.1 hypothetical protein [Bacteroidales bacterium]HOM36465.1 hypothetical protein [Bacteroidales bacterium]HPD23976.1 hypothetical protein [Bacteroidales bacterium]HRS98509.1 hypothetical protein [Bacteroidales bacterium]
MKNFLILFFIFTTGILIAQNFSSNKFDSNFRGTQNRIFAGTSFGNYYGQNIFLSYAGATSSFNVNPKLRLSVGLLSTYDNLNYGRTDFVLNSSTQIANKINPNVYIIASGEYFLNDKMKIRSNNLINVEDKKYSYYSFGIDYKIGEKSFFSADVSFSGYDNKFPRHGMNPGLFYDNPYIRPFSNDIFTEPFRQW